MESPIDRLYNEFRMHEYSTDDTINLIEKNSIIFGNIRAFSDESELRLYIELAWQYINALVQKGRFNQGIDSSINYLKIIDSEVDRLN
jgi:hypothetical protein